MKAELLSVCAVSLVVGSSLAGAGECPLSPVLVGGNVDVSSGLTTQRRNPIYQTTIVGRPPQEDGWLGWATERLFMPAIRMALPEVVDLKLPVEACFHNLAIVSIKKRFVLPHSPAFAACQYQAIQFRAISHCVENPAFRQSCQSAESHR